jgi:hypothetical protein
MEMRKQVWNEMRSRDGNGMWGVMREIREIENRELGIWVAGIRGMMRVNRDGERKRGEGGR